MDVVSMQTWLRTTLVCLGNNTVSLDIVLNFKVMYVSLLKGFK